MKKKIAITAVILFFSTILFAQKKTRDFELILSDQPFENSLYRYIECLDSRPDTTNLGIVQVGLMNAKARVIPKTPFSVQLTHLLNSLTDSTAKDGRLLLQLKHFNFAEVTGAFSEKGYFYFRANLYVVSNGKYRTIASVDTLMVTSGMDVTKSNMKNGSIFIGKFIARNLLNKPADSTVGYTMDEVVNIDSIEKQQFRLYSDTSYQEGLYLSWRSFRDQIPDKQIVVEMNKDVATGRIADAKGKMVKVRPKDAYAVVVRGKPFISTEFGFYPLEKRNNNFFFTGKAKVSPNSADVVAASMFFGIIGGLLASSGDVATFDMQIDYVSGGFIHLRQIEMPPSEQTLF